MNSASISGPENSGSLFTVPLFIDAMWREIPLLRQPIWKGALKVSYNSLSLCAL